LIDDLNRAHYNGAISDVAGVQYTGIVRATADTLVMKVPYGELGLPWNRVPPATLLRISMSFIDSKSADAADRNWLCAVYANEAGQAEDAKRLGSEAAKAKPEYAQMLPVLVESESK